MPFLFSFLKITGFLNPDIVWITDPRHFSVLRQVRYKKLFYRCVDDLEAFSDIPEGLVHYEQEVVKIANACFFTSNELLNKFRGLNPASFYLPNGCDYEFFQGEEAGADVKAFFKEEMLNFLYMGTIGEWFDFEVIEKLSEDPSHNIVLVGPVRVSIPQKLKSKRNVVFVGPYPYERMKEFANSANVGLIPFKVNSITDSVNPIKLYEYCAAGLPVISAGFRTILDLDGPFVIYRDFIELSNSVIWAKSAIQDEKSIEEIKRFGKLNSWQNRSDFVSSFFEG
jgi:glycosyltransferase involved in cell wall biosynthesis